MTQPTSEQATTAAITADIAAARTELGRVDAKASTLLAVEGVLIALLVPVLLAPATGAVIGRPIVALLITLLVLSAGTLLVAVYPRLPRLPGSLADLADMTPAQVAAAYADPAGVLQARAAQLPGLNQLAVAKYRMLRTAMFPLFGAGVLLLAALAVAATV
jgi:hypothetical protein